MQIKMEEKKRRLLTMLTAFLLLSMFSINAEAQSLRDQDERPTEELEDPEAHVITDKGNVQWACYTLEGGKQLATIIIDYHTLWGYIRSIEIENASLKREISLLKSKVGIWKQETANQTQRGNIYEKMYKSEYELRLKLENQSNFKQWIPWAILIIETTAFAFVTTYNAVNSAK